MELRIKVNKTPREVIQSNYFGYPNLAHPNNHFNITPFEAIYCDPQTYQHIKMQESVDDDNLNDNYLVYLRDFILDEVEADIVYLQNKTIGKNHVQWKPSYRYKAWYKAHDKIVFGSNVTPKTDPGPYIIEKTGEITAYACNGVLLTDGFHTKQGSSFHAFEYCVGCSRPREKSGNSGNEEDEGEMRQKAPLKIIEEKKQGTEISQLKVYPNPSDKEFTIAFSKVEGEYIISNVNGKIIQKGDVYKSSMLIHLSEGIYFIKWINKNGIQTQKMIAL